ncbi:colicin-like pore-forming protein [Escherichia coli]
MAVDIYVNPPRVDVFHGTPPAWSSFGNKTIWGGNEWVDDSPTRSDIEKRDKEITAYKNTLSAQQKENENKRTEAGKRLSAAIAAREKDENTLKTLRAGNADAADITRQEFRLLQAELREYGFRTEIAGYDALRLHTENRANLNYLLTHSGLDYKRNILNDRNPVVTEDVEGDKKIYNAEVAEWDKLRQRLLDARNKITSAESAVNSARNNLSARTNEQKHANDALNALLKEKENIRNQLAGINQKIAEEKRKQDELKATKDAINFTTEFLKSVSEKYGAKAEQLAREMAGQAKGKKIRNVEEALKTYEKYRADINKKINAKDRAAIAAALESVKLSDISSNLNRFSRGLGYAGKFTSLADWITEFGKAVRTENWRPLFVKTEAIIAGNAATALVALVFSILTGSALGIIGYGLLMAVTGALIDESLVEKANKFWGI